MQLVRGLYNCRADHTGSVLTIGNFDGLHLGHRAMLERLNQLATELDTHSILMSFEPLPGEYFSRLHKSNAHGAGARLMNRHEKVQSLCQFEHRPDYLLLMRFNQALASMSAAQFIHDILLDTLQIRGLIIGDDFRFGNDRQGDFEMLREYGEQHGFIVEQLQSHHVAQHRVSSTLIRDALRENSLQDAEAMLGRPYTICGRVNHGDKRGRTIGFPTANIHLKRSQTPLHGVYSVTMHSQKHGDVAGIANLGRRPTVDGERIQLEVHLFDFDTSLYGDRVCVSFQHKIRDEKKFESFEELKQQILHDVDTAKKLINNH